MPDLAQARYNIVSELLRISQVIGDLGSHFDVTGHRLYLVGSSVRDVMLGRLRYDLNLAISVRPEETHVIPRDFASTTWDIGRDFGIVGTMKKKGGKEWQVGITILRADTYEPDSCKPVVIFGERIEEDLVHRGFAVNATVVGTVAGEFVDPWGGLRDLADGVPRIPAPAEVSFGDDLLRMTWATRFTLRLGLRVAPGVQGAMRETAERIIVVSMRCVQAELAGLLFTNSPRKGLDLLMRTGAAEHLLFELSVLRLEHDKRIHHKGVYAHSLIVLERAINLEKARGHQPDIVNRLAALLRDIGKPATHRLEGSKVAFHHHNVVSAKLVTKRLKALRHPMATVKSVAKLVELHLRFHGYGEASWSDPAVRRYVHGTGDELEHLHTLAHADCTTRNRNKATWLRRNYEELERRIDGLTAQEETKAIRPDLDGAQVMEVLGITPGPGIGKTYKFLLNHRMDNGPLPGDEIRDLLLTWWKDQQPQS